MKKPLKTLLLIVVLTLLYYSFVGYELIVQRYYPNFLHYSKIGVIYYSAYLLQCFFILCGICTSIWFFKSKSESKFLKGLAFICLSLLACGFLVTRSSDGIKLIENEMFREKNIIEFGEKILNKVKDSERGKMPEFDNWRDGLALNDEAELMLDLLSYNKNVSGLSLANMPSNTVILTERRYGLTVSKEFINSGVTIETNFKNSCDKDFLLLYTADFKVVVYIKQSDEYRYFDSHEPAEVVWDPLLE